MLILIFFVATQTVSQVLWGQLDTERREQHISCVELFYRLHCLAPSSSICEDIICQALLHKDKVAECTPNSPKTFWMFNFNINKFVHINEKLNNEEFTRGPFFCPRPFDSKPYTVSQFCGT